MIQVRMRKTNGPACPPIRLEVGQARAGIHEDLRAVASFNQERESLAAITGFVGPRNRKTAARAAEKFGIPFTLSTMSICSIEDIAEHTSAPFWYQLYMMRGRE